MRSTRPELPGARPDEERVLHLPRRVVGAEVQGVEVEPLRLDLGPLGDLPAHRDEDVGDRARPASPAGAARRAGARSTGSVTSTASSTSTRCVALGLELGLPRGERRGRPRPRAGAEQLAGRGLVGGREAADLAVGERERAAVAGVLEADLLERVEVARRPRGRERVRRRRLRRRRRRAGTGRCRRTSGPSKWSAAAGARLSAGTRVRPGRRTSLEAPDPGLGGRSSGATACSGARQWRGPGTGPGNRRPPATCARAVMTAILPRAGSSSEREGLDPLVQRSPATAGTRAATRRGPARRPASAAPRTRRAPATSPAATSSSSGRCVVRVRVGSRPGRSGRDDRRRAWPAPRADPTDGEVRTLARPVVGRAARRVPDVHAPAAEGAVDRRASPADARPRACGGRTRPAPRRRELVRARSRAATGPPGPRRQPGHRPVGQVAVERDGEVPGLGAADQPHRRRTARPAHARTEAERDGPR